MTKPAICVAHQGTHSRKPWWGLPVTLTGAKHGVVWRAIITLARDPITGPEKEGHGLQNGKGEDDHGERNLERLESNTGDRVRDRVITNSRG